MFNDDDDAPSLEDLTERMIHESAGLSDFALDDRLAEATAHRDAAAAHGRDARAAVWNNVAIALHDVRTARADVAREVEDLTGPPRPDGGELELPGDAL